jgi:hypothetical protein
MTTEFGIYDTVTLVSPCAFVPRFRTRAVGDRMTFSYRRLSLGEKERRVKCGLSIVITGGDLTNR